MNFVLLIVPRKCSALMSIRIARKLPSCSMTLIASSRRESASSRESPCSLRNLRLLISVMCNHGIGGGPSSTRSCHAGAKYRDQSSSGAINPPNENSRLSVAVFSSEADTKTAICLFAKSVTGDFGKFTDFMRRLVAVPHSEIRAKLDAEKLAKKQQRGPSSRAKD